MLQDGHEDIADAPYEFITFVISELSVFNSYIPLVNVVPSVKSILLFAIENVAFTFTVFHVIFALV